MIFKELFHPEYLYDDFIKWRLTYKGGRDFVNQYLESYSSRESDADFKIRKKISYCPAFAKAAVNEIKNAIFQRMTDIKRNGGSESYQKAINGEKGGVDRCGSSMNTFIGTEILPEMLTMRKVGIFVDRPNDPGTTLLDSKPPYLYYYQAEAIRSWTYNEDNQLTNLLLEDTRWTYENNLPSKVSITFRKLELINGNVHVSIYDDKENIIEEYDLNIPVIPFVLFELSDSLLTDVADYQIALLNLASSDLGYLLKANVPFYTEQYSPNAETTHLKPVEGETGESKKEIKVGATVGRKYPIGTERPDFIHPSSEPLQASMNKQAQLKDEIRLLVQLAVSNLEPPKNVSAETRGFDERTLDAGLSYIGLILEWGENQINLIWAAYESNNNKNLNSLSPALTKYPEKYSLTNNKDKREEAEKLLTLVSKIQTLKGKKYIVKRALSLLIGDSVSNDQLQAAYQEIDTLEVIDDPEQLLSDLEAGIVDPETASKARLYPEGVVAKAQTAHIERAKAIAMAQAAANPAARGVNDMASNNSGAKDEKATSQDASQNNNFGGKKTK
jgi:hypothetical protein